MVKEPPPRTQPGRRAVIAGWSVFRCDNSWLSVLLQRPGLPLVTLSVSDGGRRSPQCMPGWGQRPGATVPCPAPGPLPLPIPVCPLVPRLPFSPPPPCHCPKEAHAALFLGLLLYPMRDKLLHLWVSLFSSLKWK